MLKNESLLRSEHAQKSNLHQEPPRTKRSNKPCNFRALLSLGNAYLRVGACKYRMGMPKRNSLKEIYL